MKRNPANQISFQLKQKEETLKELHTVIDCHEITQNTSARTEKHVPAFCTLEGGHTVSIHFRGILLYTQKQKEATK